MVFWVLKWPSISKCPWISILERGLCCVGQTTDISHERYMPSQGLDGSCFTQPTPMSYVPHMLCLTRTFMLKLTALWLKFWSHLHLACFLVAMFSQSLNVINRYYDSTDLMNSQSWCLSGLPLWGLFPQPLISLVLRRSDVQLGTLVRFKFKLKWPTWHTPVFLTFIFFCWSLTKKLSYGETEKIIWERWQNQEDTM